MTRSLRLLATLALFSAGAGISETPLLAQDRPMLKPISDRPLGTIERLDPRFDALVPAEAHLDRLAEGYDWSEGPVWDKAAGVLYFSDVPKNVVHRWAPKSGAAPFLSPSGYTGTVPRGGEPGSNGLAIDLQGRLILCQHGDRRLARLDDGKFTPIADRHEGKRFNSPNDVVVHSSGDLYFTDPPYGLIKGNEDPSREIPYNGVYRVARDGTVTLITKELTFPNGLAFSPDEKTLYVANSDPDLPIWLAYPVKPDGTLGESRVFADVTKLARDKNKPGLPDGMKIDVAGNLFATGPGGVLVFAPDGTHLGTIATGVSTGNCAWGDDGSTLYVTADATLARIRLTTRGAGFR